MINYNDEKEIMNFDDKNDLTKYKNKVNKYSNKKSKMIFKIFFLYYS